MFVPAGCPEISTDPESSRLEVWYSWVGGVKVAVHTATPFVILNSSIYPLKASLVPYASIPIRAVVFE